jgi:translation initiation factor IF-2
MNKNIKINMPFNVGILINTRKAQFLIKYKNIHINMQHIIYNMQEIYTSINKKKKKSLI